MSAVPFYKAANSTSDVPPSPFVSWLFFPHLEYHPYHRTFARLGDMIMDMHHTMARSRGEAVALPHTVSHRLSCRTQVSTPQETRVPGCICHSLAPLSRCTRSCIRASSQPSHRGLKQDRALVLQMCSKTWKQRRFGNRRYRHRGGSF